MAFKRYDYKEAVRPHRRRAFKQCPYSKWRESAPLLVRARGVLQPDGRYRVSRDGLRRNQKIPQFNGNKFTSPAPRRSHESSSLSALHNRAADRTRMAAQPPAKES